jgi:hypothetical protein
MGTREPVAKAGPPCGRVLRRVHDPGQIELLGKEVIGRFRS